MLVEIQKKKDEEQRLRQEEAIRLKEAKEARSKEVTVALEKERTRLNPENSTSEPNKEFKEANSGYNFFLF